MILLSALLASLTGLVAGERPAERAQVELSAAAAIVQSGETAGQAAVTAQTAQPRLDRDAPQMGRMDRPAPVRVLRTFLSLKQSWLI